MGGAEKGTRFSDYLKGVGLKDKKVKENKRSADQILIDAQRITNAHKRKRGRA